MPVMRARLLIALASGLLVGCGSQGTAPAPPVASSPTALALTGHFTLTSESITQLPGTGACVGSGGYDDIVEGAQVVVTDEKGTVLAATTLQAGVMPSSVQCRFLFTTSVPPGHQFYGVQVSHRGVLQFTEAQISAGAIELTLG